MAFTKERHFHYQIIKLSNYQIGYYQISYFPNLFFKAAKASCIVAGATSFFAG